tara:strand:- start:415 stop:858 length:444 start_codon:yes stop_codon:yes gene_type:complete
MKGKSNWYGRECEGRYADIDTVFVRTEIPDNYKEYPHIYFTIEYVRNCNQAYLPPTPPDAWDDILEILETNQVVTIEADRHTIKNIPLGVFNRVHIIYRIEDRYPIDLLKNTDTISIDTGKYASIQSMKGCMQRITPDDYKYDRNDK